EFALNVHPCRKLVVVAPQVVFEFVIAIKISAQGRRSKGQSETDVLHPSNLGGAEHPVILEKCALRELLSEGLELSFKSGIVNLHRVQGISSGVDTLEHGSEDLNVHQP